MTIIIDVRTLTVWVWSGRYGWCRMTLAQFDAYMARRAIQKTSPIAGRVTH